MKVRLQWVFVWLGLSVAAILFSFHLYLHERGDVREVAREMGRFEELKERDWAAPISSYLTRSDYRGRERGVRKLHSVGGTNVSSSGRESSTVLAAGGGSDGMISEMRAVNRTTGGEVTVGEERGEGDRERGEEEGDYYEEQLWTKLAEDQTNVSKTGSTNLTDRFSLRSSFSLPTPEATLPLPQLAQCQWLDTLRGYLSSLKAGSQLVSIVSSDYKYREVLLNWLLTAQVKIAHPLSNVLVLSLDGSLHQLLTARDIPCVHIPVSCLLKPGLKLTKHVAFTQVHIMRVLVMRLLNHWGFDVANYDSDALILRSPEPRYQQLGDCHVIGSVGHFPHEMDKKWGTAVCIGVVLIRASPQTELYWQAMSAVIPDNTNDQARLNWALDAMDMVWDNSHCNTAVCTLTGSGRGGLRVAVLPSKDICRQTCMKKKIKGYYIWHKGGAQNRDGKKSYASQGGLWYLHDNWEHITHRTSSTGLHWLREIAR